MRPPRVPLRHDPRDPRFRAPGWGTTPWRRTGAVPVGTPVRLALAARRGDLRAALLHVREREDARWIPLRVEREEEGVAWWSCRLSWPLPAALRYRFLVVTDAEAVWHAPGSQGAGWRLVVHDPAFRAPEWHKRAVAYEAMLDSFRNGDPTNDPVGDGASGDVRWWEWRHGGRAYARKLQPHEPRGGYDRGVTYYGGDLQGLAQGAEHLASLGVTQLYLTPWHPSPDYHGYSVSDPLGVEPYYGVVARREPHGEGASVVVGDEEASLAAFDAALARLREAGIRVVGDLVLNHLGAQSRPFRRFERDLGVPDPWPGEEAGAFQSPESPYARWFRFRRWPDAYEAWWDFLELPVVRYDQAPDAWDPMLRVVDHWHARGVAGYRLDVANEYADGAGSHALNRAIRARVKALDTEAPIIGERWGDASPWLAGDQHDGTMDYRFRDAVLHYLLGKGGAALLVDRLRAIEEDYPLEAQLASWRLVGSHDTPRVRTALGGDRALHHLAALLQFTLPGVPLVYHGDELGMEGGDDPDNRSYMAWDAPDEATLAWYRLLGRLRREIPALGPDGGCEILLADGDGLAFARAAPGSVALVAMHLGDAPRDVTIPLAPEPSVRAPLAPGTPLRDAVSDATARVDEAGRVRVTLPPKGARVLVPW